MSIFINSIRSKTNESTQTKVYDRRKTTKDTEVLREVVANYLKKILPQKMFTIATVHVDEDYATREIGRIFNKKIIFAYFLLGRIEKGS